MLFQPLDLKAWPQQNLSPSWSLNKFELFTLDYFIPLKTRSWVIIIEQNFIKLLNTQWNCNANPGLSLKFFLSWTFCLFIKDNKVETILTFKVIKVIFWNGWHIHESIRREREQDSLRVNHECWRSNRNGYCSSILRLLVWVLGNFWKCHQYILGGNFYFGILKKIWLIYVLFSEAGVSKKKPIIHAV